MIAVRAVPIRAPTAIKAAPMMDVRADPRFGAVVDANRDGMARERIGERAWLIFGRKRADGLN